MRNKRILLLLPLSIAFGAFGALSAACGSSSGGGSNAGDCFDYSSFNGMSPTVSFSAQVEPIFRNSCGLSSSCHGCDPSSNPGCTSPGVPPFLGTPSMDGPMTTAQIMAMQTTTVGVTAMAQASSVDPPAQVGDPDLMIIKAGDPQHSFMMYKLDGDPNASDPNSEVSCSTLTCAGGKSCGLAMPSGGPQLSQDSRDTIRRWIAQGASFTN